jgi:hypothetical protein
MAIEPVVVRDIHQLNWIKSSCPNAKIDGPYRDSKISPTTFEVLQCEVYIVTFPNEAEYTLFTLKWLGINPDGDWYVPGLDSQPFMEHLPSLRSVMPQAAATEKGWKEVIEWLRTLRLS